MDWIGCGSKCRQPAWIGLNLVLKIGLTTLGYLTLEQKSGDRGLRIDDPLYEESLH